MVFQQHRSPECPVARRSAIVPVFPAVLIGPLLVLFIILLSGCNPNARGILLRNFVLPVPKYAVTQKPDPNTWPSDRITVTWIGHSTVLLNVYGTTILTDPALCSRIGPNIFGHVNLGVHRIGPPALSFEELPRIDLVLLSHAHHDHWDMATLKDFRSGTSAIIPPGDSDLVPGNSFGQVTELGWGQTAQVGDVTIEAIAVNHWGSRPTSALHARGYNGYVISCRGRRIVFAGDTSFVPDFDVRAGKKPDLFIAPIGAYDPWIHNHTSPEQAWAMFDQVEGQWMLPIHWRTFVLSQEPIEEPMQRLLAVARERKNQVVCREPGETFVLP
jgi:L-ascorbate metabolism protein UlaG (beta-lactamase superfamily)